MSGKFDGTNFEGIRYDSEGIKAYEGSMVYSTRAFTGEKKWLKQGKGQSFYTNGNVNYSGLKIGEIILGFFIILMVKSNIPAKFATENSKATASNMITAPT